MFNFLKNKKRKKVGLALGSGGFRGPAHIAVVKTLIENGIPIDYIAGSSAGALIGAHYALFKDLSKLEEDVFEQQSRKYSYFRDLNLSRGFLSGRALEKGFFKMFNGAKFEDLQIPLKIVATDLVSGESHIFKSGDLAFAVRASISIPIAFKPLKLGNKILVDGGISNPVPDDVVEDMGPDIIISVNLYNKYDLQKNSLSLARVAMRSIEIALLNRSVSTTNNSDIIINPDTSKFSKLSRLKTYFSKKISLEIMDVAKKEAEKSIPDIKKLLNS
jgi:NTE family protein